MTSPGPEIGTGRRGRPDPRLAFGPFELDPAAGVLRGSGQGIAIAAKPFELLLYLARRPGRVVSRRDLLDALWPEGSANEDAVVHCVVEARRALGEASRHTRYLRTVPRRGYLFAAEVTAVEDEAEAEAPRPQLVLAFPTPAPAETTRPLRLPARLGRSRRPWRRPPFAVAGTMVAIVAAFALIRLIRG